MTTILNASNSAGLVAQADTSAILQLQTGNTAAMTIDASQNVGIGTASPYARLQVLGTIKVATGNAQGILALGEANGTTNNVGIWRGAANAPTTDGNFLNFGGYDGLVFATGNAAIGSQTERMRIDSSGNVGIGTNSPAAKLHISGTADELLRLDTSTSNPYLNFRISGTRKAYIQYSEGSGLLLDAEPAGKPLILLTQGFERVRINAGAPILCLAGGNTSATGTGIAFPATQSASSDANTLDDYEEGTYTPDVVNNGASSTWSVKQGAYRKIGSFVTVWFNCSGTGNSGGGGGAVIVTLPFAMASGQPGFFGLLATIGGTGSPYEQINAAGGTSIYAQVLYNVAGNQEQGTLTTVRACFSYITN